MDTTQLIVLFVGILASILLIGLMWLTKHLALADKQKEIVTSLSTVLSPALLLLVNQTDKALAPYGDKLQALNLVALGAKKALADYQAEIPPGLFAVVEAAVNQIEAFTNGVDDTGSPTPD